MQVRERLVPAHPDRRDSMNSWGPAPGGPAPWSTGLYQSSVPAWPPYKLPSDYQPSSSTSVQQNYYTHGTSRPSGQGLHGLRPQIPEQSTPQQRTPSNNTMMQGALTTVNQQPDDITYHAPYGVHNQPHGGLPLESYFTVHLQYPKTWVHLWDRLPLREPEILISSGYKMEMFVHNSAIPTLRAVASGSMQSVPMLAVCCDEFADRGIRIRLYNDTYDGGPHQKPLRVDTFVAVNKTLPSEEQDDIAVVNSLASAFQAACNTSSLPRLCHLLPMALTAKLGTPFQSKYPRPESEGDPSAELPVELSGIMLQPHVSVSLTQLHRMKVLQCMLTARLMHGGAENEDERFRSGVLSIEQSRALVPLLYADPMANQAPLVGVWVSGISSITESLVLSATLAFHASNTKQTKAVAPDGSFLVLAFISSSTNAPEVYEACLTSPRGVPLMPFSASAEVPAPVDPILKALSSSPTPESQAYAEKHKEYRELSKAVLIERPHLLYNLFLDRAPQAAASALAAVSASGGTASASLSASALPGSRHMQERVSAASLSAWRTDALTTNQATSRHSQQARSAGIAAEGTSGHHALHTQGMSSTGHRPSHSIAAYQGITHSTNPSPTPSHTTSLQGVPAGGQGTDATGIQIPMTSQHMANHGAGTGVSAVPMPQDGVPPVPSPSPLVGHSMTPFHGHSHASQQSAAKTPALGIADRGAMHALPGAAVTGPGPLSAGSIPFAPSSVRGPPPAGRYGPLFDTYQASGPVAVPPHQQHLPYERTSHMAAAHGPPATPAPVAMQDSGVPSMHSNMHALFVGSAPTQHPAQPAVSMSVQSTQQQGQDTAAQNQSTAQRRSTADAPASAIGGYGSGGAGVPEWLASAVHRHPDLAPLLRDQAAIAAKEGLLTAETPAGSGTPAAGSTAGPPSVAGDFLPVGFHSIAAEQQSVAGVFQPDEQHYASGNAAPGEQAALAELLNGSAAPSAAQSDVYQHLLAPEPGARDLASTRRTSFADDPSINGSVARGTHAASCADQVQQENTPAPGWQPTDVQAPVPTPTVAPAHDVHNHPYHIINHSSVQGMESHAPMEPLAGALPAIMTQQSTVTHQQPPTQSTANDCRPSLSLPQAIPVCADPCAQEGPSTPRTKRGTCEPQSSSKKQRISLPPAMQCRSPQCAPHGTIQNEFTTSAERCQVAASDIVQTHPNYTASSLAHLPVPTLPVSATQDPETASALAPLYDYIGKLRQHIALLQDQVCHLSGRVTTGDSTNGAAEKCSQSMAALQISQGAAAQVSRDGATRTANVVNHAAIWGETQTRCPTQAAPDHSVPRTAAPDASLRESQHHPASVHRPPSATHAATEQPNAAASASGSRTQHPQPPAAEDVHRRRFNEPAHASTDQNDALEAIVDAFLVSSSGGVHDSLPTYPPSVHALKEPNYAGTKGKNRADARRKDSDATLRRSHQHTAFQHAQGRAPLSPQSLNIPQSPAPSDAAMNTAAHCYPSKASGSLGTPAAASSQYRIGDQGSAALSECQSSAGAPPWGRSNNADTAALAASRDGSTRSVMTPPPVDVQDGRHSHARNGSGATCLSPELAALIRDAEDINGQEYEDSLCLREETSFSEANTSRFRSSNGGAVGDADQRTRRPRWRSRDVESEDADELGGAAESEGGPHALVIAATARAKEISKLSERSHELVQRAKEMSLLSSGMSATGGAQTTAVSVRNTKRGGSARGSSGTGRPQSSRPADPLLLQCAATASNGGHALAAVALPQKLATIPRIQLPATGAGKKALKSLMKDKGLKKMLRDTDLIDEEAISTTEGDTTTSVSDDEELQKLEKKYGLRS